MNDAYQRFHAFSEKKCASRYIEGNDVSILHALDAWSRKHLKQIQDLDEYIYTIKTKKENTKKIILEFYHSCDEPVETILNDIVIIDDPTRRIIEEVKYLQTPHTQKDIAYHFGLSEKSIQRDLNQLEQGITILGNEVSIKTVKEGKKKKLQAFLQPLYLSLTNTEILSLTKGLDDLSQLDPVYGTCLKRIAGKVYGQLSSEMQSMIDMQTVSNDFNEDTLDEIATELGYKQQIIMMLNEHRKGTISVSINDELKIFSDCYLENYHVQYGSITIHLKDHSKVIVKVDDIFNCEAEGEA